MAILAVGLLPYLDLLRGARGLLSESGDILALENRCLQALSEARSMVVQGRIGQVPPDGEEVLQASEDGVRYSVTVTRLAGDRAFKLMARAESEDRFFQVSRVVADPITSFYTPIPGAGGPP